MAATQTRITLYDEKYNLKGAATPTSLTTSQTHLPSTFGETTTLLAASCTMLVPCFRLAQITCRNAVTPLLKPASGNGKLTQNRISFILHLRAVKSPKEIPKSDTKDCIAGNIRKKNAIRFKGGGGENNRISSQRQANWNTGFDVSSQSSNPLHLLSAKALFDVTKAQVSVSACSVKPDNMWDSKMCRERSLISCFSPSLLVYIWIWKVVFCYLSAASNLFAYNSKIHW